MRIRKRWVAFRASSGAAHLVAPRLRQAARPEGLAQLKQEFPSLYRAWRKYGSPDLEETWLGFLVQQFFEDGIEFEMAQVNKSLERLLARFEVEALQDPLGALFGSRKKNQRENAFRKANTELYALAECERMGVLAGLGWPRGFGDTPPFDLQLGAANAVMPVDVKDANGDGLRVMETALERIVRPWAEANGIPPYRITLRYLGVMSQRSIGDNLRQKGTFAGFGEWLAAHATMPSGGFRLKVDETSLLVRIIPAKSALAPSGGIQPRNPLARVLAATFADHVQDKSKHAQRTPFLLLYVQLSGYGASDIKTTGTFHAATLRVSEEAKALEHDAYDFWLGSIFVHPKGTTMERYCCLRPVAAWPHGLTPEELSRRLEGALTLV